MQKINSTLKYVISICVFFYVPSLLAAQSLGSISDYLVNGPLYGIGKLGQAIAFIAGAGFLLAGIFQYKNYRDNPQQVRLSTPITYLILGLVLIALPFIAMLSAGSGFLTK